jgi:hypothetical protein
MLLDDFKKFALHHLLLISGNTLLVFWLDFIVRFFTQNTDAADLKTRFNAPA